MAREHGGGNCRLRMRDRMHAVTVPLRHTAGALRAAVSATATSTRLTEDRFAEVAEMLERHASLLFVGRD